MLFNMVSNDVELSRIIEKMLSETIKKKETTKCCKRVFEGEVEIYRLEELENLLETCKVVFINFYSPACGYCKMFQPVFTHVGDMFRGNAVFAKVNVMHAPEVAWYFNVRGTPTTIALIEGRVEAFIPGYVNIQTFTNIVKKLLEKAKCL